jgi:RNA polymerase sigma-70 factor, ECF subfamily
MAQTKRLRRQRFTCAKFRSVATLAPVRLPNACTIQVDQAVSKPETIAAEIPRLRRYARALVGNETEADDLVQDTLERALSRLHLPHSSESPRRWLLTILHNIHVDHQRGHARRPPMSELDETVPDPASRPEDGVTKCEVSAALQRLPLEQRQVLLLVGLEGLSYAETAAVLDVPIGTVMSRLARGREKLRQILDHPASPARQAAPPSLPSTSSPPTLPAAALRRVK